MDKKKFLIIGIVAFVIVLIFTIYIIEGKIWVSSSTINSSLPDIGDYSSPSVFQMGSQWHLISGHKDGKFKGFTWNGTNWNKNATINASLPDIGGYSNPSVFNISSKYHLITGEYYGKFYGYTWNGTNWNKNATINASLPDIGSNSALSVFYKDSKLHLISGEFDGQFGGYTYNGTNWNENSSIIGFLYLQYLSTPTVFQMGTQWHLISGLGDGKFKGFTWDGDSWNINSTINASLPDIGSYSTPNVFNMSGQFYIISGAEDGKFKGFKLTSSPPSVTINSPLNQSYTTATINFNVTATADGEISTCRYSFNNGVKNYTMDNLTATQWNATNSSMTQGSKTVTFFCNDTEDNINGTEKKVFFIDSIIPKIISPENAVLEYGGSVLSADFDATETNPSSWSINWTNTFMINSEGILTEYFEFDPPMANYITPGIYKINVSFNDTVGNINSTIFTVTSQDTTDPIVYLDSPVNGTNSSNTGLDVEFTADEYLCANATWNDNSGANTTLADCNTDITAPTWSQGMHNITIFVRDTSNNLGKAYVSFLIVTTPPEIVQQRIWVKNVTINASLPDIGNIPSPCIFQIGSKYHLISGNSNGKFNSFTWNGTAWTKNATINASLPDIGGFSSPSVFQIGSQRHLITGSYDGYMRGFTWNGTGWNVNTTINKSLPSYQFSTTTVFNTSTTRFNLIIGTGSWGFKGFTWNGTQWIVNATINMSLPKIPFMEVSPNVFQMGSQWHMLYGSGVGNFYGYTWNNTNWIANATINASLPDIGNRARPSVFQMDSQYYLIAGEHEGSFKGFTYIIDTTQEIYNNESLYYDINATDSGVGLGTFGINWTSVFSINYSTGVLINISSLNASNYYINVSINDTLGNTFSDIILVNVTATDSEAPVITKITPTNTYNFSSGNNVYFNFNATDDSIIDTCQLWTNTTGTWEKNYTWVNPTGVINYTIPNIREGRFKWNIWCNDSKNNYNFSTSNYTFTIDETAPNMTISNTNGSTEPYGDLTTKINYTASDTHLKSCYYTLRNSAGALHNYPENTSIDCSATSISISSLYFGTFVVQFWGEDYSGNLDESSLTFITVGEGGAGGSSGGGGTSLSSSKNMVNLKFKMHYYNNGLEYIMDDIGQYYMPNMTYDAFSVEVIGENVGTDDLLLNLVNVTPKEFNSRMSRTPEYLKAYEEKSLWTSGVMLVKDFKSDEKYEFFINVASNNSNFIKYVNSTLFLDFSHERLEFPKFSILNVGNTVYEGKPLLGLAILVIVAILLIPLLYKKRR